MASRVGTVARSRAAASDVAFLGAFFVVFLGEAGFFVPFNATTFFIGVVVMTVGCLLVGVTFLFMDSSNIYNNAIFYGYLRGN